MNNNRGISLIALTVMIIVMLIIAGIAMNAGTTGYEQAIVAKNREENKQVSNAVNNRFGEYTMKPNLKPLVGEVIPSEYFEEENMTTRMDNIEEYLINMFRSEGRLATQDELDNKTIQVSLHKFLQDNQNDMDYTRILRHSHIIELGLDSIALTSEFVVNYYSADVVGPIQ